MTIRSSIATALVASAAAGTALLASCSSLTEPPIDARVYVLRSIGGESLPAVVDANSLGTTSVVSDTIRFFDHLTGHGAMNQRIQMAGDPTVYRDRRADEFTYGTTGDRILMRFRCSYFGCPRGWETVATLEGDSILRSDSPLGEWMYERVAAP